MKTKSTCAATNALSAWTASLLACGISPLSRTITTDLSAEPGAGDLRRGGLPVGANDGGLLAVGSELAGFAKPELIVLVGASVYAPRKSWGLGQPVLRSFMRRRKPRLAPAAAVPPALEQSADFYDHSGPKPR